MVPDTTKCRQGLEGKFNAFSRPSEKVMRRFELCTSLLAFSRAHFLSLILLSQARPYAELTRLFTEMGRLKLQINISWPQYSGKKKDPDQEKGMYLSLWLQKLLLWPSSAAQAVCLHESAGWHAACWSPFCRQGIQGSCWEGAGPVGHFWRLVWLQSRAHDRDHHSARNCESKHSNLLLYYSLTSFVNINVMQNFHLSTFENTRMKL